MAKILFRPICSNCGKQLFGVISFEYDTDFLEKAGVLYRTAGRVEPDHCPYCNEWFEGIEMICGFTNSKFRS